MPDKKNITELFGGTATKKAFDKIHKNLFHIKGLRTHFDAGTNDFSVGLNKTVGQEAIPGAVGAAHDFYSTKINKLPGVMHVDNFQFKVI